MPPLDWLRAFEGAARLGSFTSASAELGLTQAAVSHRVRSLEKHFGVVLFERLARNLRLTELGEAYLPPVRHAFDGLMAATAGLFGPIGERTLVIQAPVSFATLWLAPRLGDFSKAYPGIGLRIVSTIWARAPDEAKADVEIRVGDGRWTGHRAELLAHRPAIIVCRPDLAPEGETAERVAALIKRPLIHVTAHDNAWRRLIAKHGLTAPAVAGVDVDTSIAALELAAAGHGPAIVLDWFAAPLIASGRLVQAVDEPVAMDDSHYLVTPEGPRRPPAEVSIFRAWLFDQARSHQGAHS